MPDVANAVTSARLSAMHASCLHLHMPRGYTHRGSKVGACLYIAVLSESSPLKELHSALRYDVPGDGEAVHSTIVSVRNILPATTMFCYLISKINTEY